MVNFLSVTGLMSALNDERPRNLKKLQVKQTKQNKRTVQCYIYSIIT